MRFDDPGLLKYFFGLALFLAFFLFLAQRSYKRLSERFAEKRLIRRLTHSDIGRTRAARSVLDIAAIILIGVALARPQWGLSWQQKTAEGIDVLFALDLSKSMLARDVAPDRLSHAKKNIRRFVERLEGDRVGLIGFAGDAFLFCPLTADYSGFCLALDSIGVKDMPRGGTFFMAAVKEAIKAFSWSPVTQRAVILISDGEATEGDIGEAAAAAKDARIEVDCIGIGTTEGGGIRYDDGRGVAATVKDEYGRAVTSRLDEAALKRIASETGGIYVRSGADGFGLDKIYSERLSKMKKRQSEESLQRSYKEQFQYPLTLAFIALFVATLVGMTGRHEED
jgi:Ca-activated chloride channel family protein